MRILIPALSLAAAAASALAAQRPPIARSNGFLLVAHVTDPAHDLQTSVNGCTLSTIYTGASHKAAVLFRGPPLKVGALFYENGTAEQAQHQRSSIITDGDRPPVPYSITVPGRGANAPGTSEGIIDISAAGSESPAAVVVPKDGYPVLANGLGAGTFLACDVVVPYYRTNYITLQYAYASSDGHVVIPKGCAPIALVPQCASLNDLPGGSLSSHESARPVPCFEDVSSVKWRR